MSGSPPVRTPAKIASSLRARPESADSGVYASALDIDFLANALGYAIKRAQVRTYELLFTTLGPAAISPARMTALFLIGAQPGTNQSALADQLRVTRASMVKVIDNLADLGLVERHAVPDDRRSYALVLTERGRAEARTLQEKIAVFEARIAEQLTSNEREQLVRLLEKVGR